VVLGAAMVDVPAPARAVLADDWERGLGASVRTGVTAIDAALHTVEDADNVVAKGVSVRTATTSVLLQTRSPSRTAFNCRCARRRP
jgi:nicotine blue oxidoreductase